jgi:hypothetical protein
MQRNRMLIAVVALAITVAAVGAAKDVTPPRATSDLVVHEWGTFLVMQGADGVTLDGMYHEEHELPGFVHAQPEASLRQPDAIVKGETPVIYFYTNRRQRVRVEVGFPSGLWTQWYPQASQVGPRYASLAGNVRPANGRIVWQAEVVPASQKRHAVLPASNRDALWNHARHVDAAYVRTDASKGSEYERFLFYRGLGRAPLPVQASAGGAGLRWTGRGDESARHIFILRVENGRGAYRYVPALKPGMSLTGLEPDMRASLTLPQFTRRIGAELAARLTESGLYPKEALAMVNTWRESYFQTPGTRALFVLPQSWTDRYIPIRVEPRPRELVRVMVGRLEMLEPSREKKVEAAVADITSPSAETRERAYAVLAAQGRYVEPILRRLRRHSGDERVRATAEKLLRTELATSLRAANHDAATGQRVSRSPDETRKELNRLLRQMGYDEAEPHSRAVAGAIK